MKITARFALLCALAGSFTLTAAEIASDRIEETAPTPVAQIKLSAASDARVRAMENFMNANQSRDRRERLRLLTEVLRDDPGAELPKEGIRNLLETRADAREVAPELLKIAAANPANLPLAALAAQMAYVANTPPSEYLGFVRSALDRAADPARLDEAGLDAWYTLLGTYSAALKQARDYRTGSDFFASELDRDASAFRNQLLRYAIDFEYFNTLYGNRNARWFGLGASDRDAARARFDALFAELELQENELVTEDALNQTISFYLGLDRPKAALRAAEKAEKLQPSPGNKARVANVAIEAGEFDKVAPVVELLRTLDGWKGLAELINSNSLIAAGQYAEAEKAIEKIKVQLVRDEQRLKMFESQKNYKAMRDQLDEMEKHLSPGVDIDLANALRQLVVAEKLRDTALLNRVWKLLVDTKQIESSEAANSVGYVAAELNVRLDEAEKLIRDAVAGEPDNYAFLDSLAWVLYRQGKLAEAEQQIELALRASEQETGRGVIFEHKGDILLAQGRKAEALAAYREALDYPEDDDFNAGRVQKKYAELGGK